VCTVCICILEQDGWARPDLPSLSGFLSSISHLLPSISSLITPILSRPALHRLILISHSSFVHPQMLLPHHRTKATLFLPAPPFGFRCGLFHPGLLLVSLSPLQSVRMPITLSITYRSRSGSPRGSSQHPTVSSTALHRQCRCPIAKSSPLPSFFPSLDPTNHPRPIFGFRHRQPCFVTSPWLLKPDHSASGLVPLWGGFAC